MSRKDIGEVFDYTYDDSFAPALTDRVLEHYFPGDELAGKEVLDAGCRVGDFSSALLRRGARRVVGLDLSGRCVEEARRKYAGVADLDFFQGDVADLSRFADSSFDVVFCAGTMPFLPPEAARRALREFVRVARPGGVILALFLRDRGPLPRLATWIVDRIPVRPYRTVVEAAAGWLRPLGPWVLGREVSESFIKNNVLWSLQGSHYGVPAAIPEAFRVETVQCEYGSPRTTVSYKIPVSEPKERLDLGIAPG